MRNKDWEVWEKTQGRCWYCGIYLSPTGSPCIPGDRYYKPDHVIPKTRGGSNAIGNLLPACPSCNGSKGSKDLEQYRIALSIKRAGIPYFTPSQLDWLLQQGFQFDMLPPVVFWGETNVCAR